MSTTKVWIAYLTPVFCGGQWRAVRLLSAGFLWKRVKNCGRCSGTFERLSINLIWGWCWMTYFSIQISNVDKEMKPPRLCFKVYEASLMETETEGKRFRGSVQKQKISPPAALKFNSYHAISYLFNQNYFPNSWLWPCQNLISTPKWKDYHISNIPVLIQLWQSAWQAVDVFDFQLRIRVGAAVHLTHKEQESDVVSQLVTLRRGPTPKWERPKGFFSE